MQAASGRLASAWNGLSASGATSIFSSFAESVSRQNETRSFTGKLPERNRSNSAVGNDASNTLLPFSRQNEVI